MQINEADVTEFHMLAAERRAGNSWRRFTKSCAAGREGGEMSKSIGLSELIAEIGDNQLTMQPIDQSLISMNRRKNHNEIAFATDQEFDLRGTRQFGMVVWVDRDELTRARDKLLSG